VKDEIAGWEKSGVRTPAWERRKDSKGTKGAQRADSDE